MLDKCKRYYYQLVVTNIKFMNATQKYYLIMIDELKQLSGQEKSLLRSKLYDPFFPMLMAAAQEICYGRIEQQKQEFIEYYQTKGDIKELTL